MKHNSDDTLTLILPLSPSVNDSYGLTTSGGFPIKYVKKKGKDYFKDVKDYVLLNGFDIQANIRLSIKVFINFATNHKNDLDNRMKSLLDSLTKAKVWEDDSLIDEIYIKRVQPAQKPGGITIEIDEYKDSNIQKDLRELIQKMLELDNEITKEPNKQILKDQLEAMIKYQEILQTRANNE